VFPAIALKENRIIKIISIPENRSDFVRDVEMGFIGRVLLINNESCKKLTFRPINNI
jgi:hypothetical protein